MKQLLTITILLISNLVYSQTITRMGVYNYQSDIEYYTETTYSIPLYYKFETNLFSNNKLTLYQGNLSSTFDAVKEEDTFVVKLDKYKIVYYIDGN